MAEGSDGDEAYWKEKERRASLAVSRAEEPFDAFPVAPAPVRRWCSAAGARDDKDKGSKD